MAPSPAAGKKDAPQTPTKVGRSPASSSLSQLTDSPIQGGATSTTSTPRSKPPKLGASKAAQRGTSDSPKLPPRPKADDAKEKADDLESEAEGGSKRIGLKDNDADDADDDEAPGGKISQPGHDTGAESSEVADTTDLSEADPEPIADDADDTVSGAKDTVDDAAEDEGTEMGEGEGEGEDAAEEAEDERSTSGKGVTGGLKSAASGAKGLAGRAKDTATGAKDTVTGAAGKAKKGDVGGAAKDTAKDTKGAAEDTAKGAKDTAEDTADTAKETAEGAADDVPKDTDDLKDVPDKAGEAAGDVKDTAEETAEDAKDTAGETAEDAKGTAEGAKDTAEDTTEDAKDTAGEQLDISALKGLSVNEDGDVLDSEGKTIGKLDEGDAADLEGYEIGDNGEILDEDGDVIGRASVIPQEKGEELADQAGDVADDAKEGAEDAKEGAEEGAEDAKEGAEDAAGGVETYLPEIKVLEGLEVQESGEILDKDGNVLGKISEGDPADLVGMALNAEGEILDEDGDVVGRAEVVPQEVKEKAGEVLPDIGQLEGLEVDEDGAIKNADGVQLGKVTEGDPADLVGQKLNAEGEILDEDGDVIGRAEVVPVPEELKDAVEGAADGVPDEHIADLEKQLEPDITILEGKKLNKKGNILDDEGEVLAKLVEGDAKACAGKIPNENGEILDEEGNVIGKVEIVPGDAAIEAMREAHPELVQELDEAKEAAEKAAAEAGDAADEAKDAAAEEPTPDLAQLEGLKVNKKGEVLNEDGEPIAKLSEGYELEDVRGKKINDKGEILDKEGNVIGKVEFLPEAIEAGLVEMPEPEAEEEAPKELDLSPLEGYRVNKKGEVLNEDGEPIAKLSEGELADCAGKRLNDKGEVVDKEGNVLGKVELLPAGEEMVEEVAGQEEEGETGPELPPLSILEGLTVNKSGKIVDKEGNVVGELVEGDAKKLWKMGATCDDQGQFWDNKGHVIGKAQTLAREDKETDAEFAGLDGLIVVADGWVEDENGNRVGRLVEGDAKKLVGRAVDEDGDVLDKRGNAIGHAERYEEPEAEAEAEPEAVDLSELKGLTCNKQGNVIGPDGVPVARLVEGNPKELAGRKIDENGEIWNDQGKVVGRCELIPHAEREAKPEGPFAGLDGLVVVKDGLVEDAEHNVVGKLVDGDPKKLVGRAVDEDGDIIDKYGNVKGHCEPYTPEEEEVVEEDLSSLAGKKVNKQGKVVDSNGDIFGEVIEGDIKKLAGRKVDGQGQIWSDDGKVIGKAGLVKGGDDKADGPFSNFENTIVQKDGTVTDDAGQIVGKVVEGDPKKLVGRKVDDDGDILDKNGNTIGKAERWEPEEKERQVSPMAGLRVNKEGEVRDKNGDIIGRLTDGNLLHCVSKEINDNGYVIDQDGNKVGEVTLLENIPDEEEVEEGMTPEEQQAEEERETAKKISNIIGQSLEKMEPICKNITDVCCFPPPPFPPSSFPLSPFL